MPDFGLWLNLGSEDRLNWVYWFFKGLCSKWSQVWWLRAVVVFLISWPQLWIKVSPRPLFLWVWREDCFLSCRFQWLQVLLLGFQYPNSSYPSFLGFSLSLCACFLFLFCFEMASCRVFLGPQCFGQKTQLFQPPVFPDPRIWICSWAVRQVCQSTRRNLVSPLCISLCGYYKGLNGTQESWRVVLSQLCCL